MPQFPRFMSVTAQTAKKLDVEQLRRALSVRSVRERTQRAVLRLRLWPLEMRESELYAERDSIYADSLTHRELVRVGSRIRVLRAQLVDA